MQFRFGSINRIFEDFQEAKVPAPQRRWRSPFTASSQWQPFRKKLGKHTNTYKFIRPSLLNFTSSVSLRLMLNVYALQSSTGFPHTSFTLVVFSLRYAIRWKSLRLLCNFSVWDRKALCRREESITSRRRPITDRLGIRPTFVINGLPTSPRSIRGEAGTAQRQFLYEKSRGFH